MVAVVAHHKVVVWPDVNRSLTPMREVKPRIKVYLTQILAVYANNSLVYFHSVARETEDTLDVALGRVIRKPKYNYIAPFDLRRPPIFVIIDELIYKNSLAIPRFGSRSNGRGCRPSQSSSLA